MEQTQALYDDAQANEILRTAVRLAAPGEITFEELVAAASELGISRDDLRDAEAQYKKNSSDEGQKAAFREMQHHQFRLAVFHACLLGAIGLLFIFFDFRDWAVSLVPLLAMAIVIWLSYRYRDIHNERSTKYQWAFQEWQKKKEVWLKPERAKEIVDSIFTKELDQPGNLSQGPSKKEVTRQLRARFGYDKTRVKAVVEAYLREHPEVEVKLGS
jgi:hypothetical protein